MLNKITINKHILNIVFLMYVNISFLYGQWNFLDKKKFCPRELSETESARIGTLWKQVSNSQGNQACNKVQKALFYTYLKTEKDSLPIGLSLYLAPNSCEETKDKYWFQYDLPKHICLPVLVLADTLFASAFSDEKIQHLLLFDSLYKDKFSKEELDTIHTYYLKTSFPPQMPKAHFFSSLNPIPNSHGFAIKIKPQEFQMMHSTWMHNKTLREQGETMPLFCDSCVHFVMNSMILLNDSSRIGLFTYFYCTNARPHINEDTPLYYLYILSFGNKIVVSNCLLRRKIAFWEFKIRYKKLFDKREMRIIRESLNVNIENLKPQNVFYYEDIK